ncbi:MAG: hypothetical protein JW818_07565 [Pirellulales bacterium]|nr:hypothetical protein [Pirellulales bacterium]
MASTPNKPDPSTPGPSALDEQLVAYLDGELTDAAREEVEAMLNADPALRKQLARMNKAWSLLDTLDRPEIDDTFTETTLELVAIAADEDVQKSQAEAPRRRRRQWAVVIGSLVAAGAVGFLGVALARPDPNRQLLEDLPVLENLDQYEQIGQVEFLHQLRDAGLFTENPPDER